MMKENGYQQSGLPDRKGTRRCTDENHLRDARFRDGRHGGGAKLAGWLATMFSSQHSNVIGIYQSGLEEETLINAAMQFQVLTDET